MSAGTPITLGIGAGPSIVTPDGFVRSSMLVGP